MSKVTFIVNKQSTTVEAVQGHTLLQIGLENGIPIEHACGGNGFCTTCLCKVKGGMEHLSARSEREENMGITEDPERLGCQARLEGTGDVTVEIVDI